MSIRTAFSPAFFRLLLIASLLFAPARPLNAQKPPRITGTYTNMSYIKEAGDVVGYEIKIVFTGGGFQGALQIAEGVPGNLILVDIQVVDTKISFSIPDGNGPYAGLFNGAIQNGVLKGEFRFKRGGSEKVELQRGKSYWD